VPQRLSPPLKSGSKQQVSSAGQQLAAITTVLVQH
jgi:hypothetical protein